MQFVSACNCVVTTNGDEREALVRIKRNTKCSQSLLRVRDNVVSAHESTPMEFVRE